MTTAWLLSVPIALELMLPLMLLSQPMPNSTLHGVSLGDGVGCACASDPPAHDNVTMIPATIRFMGTTTPSCPALPTGANLYVPAAGMLMPNACARVESGACSWPMTDSDAGESSLAEARMARMASNS